MNIKISKLLRIVIKVIVNIFLDGNKVNAARKIENHNEEEKTAEHTAQSADSGDECADKSI